VTNYPRAILCFALHYFQIHPSLKLWLHTLSVVSINLVIDFCPPGIPVLTTVLTDIKGIKESVGAILPRMEELISSLPDVLCSEVRSSIEENAISAGHITRDVMQSTITSAFEASGLGSLRLLLEQMQSGVPLPTPNSDSSGAARIANANLHMWGGRFHAVPEDFELPSGGLLSAFQSFMCPNAELNYPPLHQLQGSDMSTANKKKCFSDYNVCCELIVKKVSVHYVIW
jgi:hypothetical protein